MSVSCTAGPTVTMRPISSCTVRSGPISSWQSAATSDIAKRCWSRVTTRVSVCLFLSFPAGARPIHIHFYLLRPSDYRYSLFSADFLASCTFGNRTFRMRCVWNCFPWSIHTSEEIAFRRYSCHSSYFLIEYRFPRNWPLQCFVIISIIISNHEAHFFSSRLPSTLIHILCSFVHEC